MSPALRGRTLSVSGLTDPVSGAGNLFDIQLSGTEEIGYKMFPK